jgi:hypothetical protein
MLVLYIGMAIITLAWIFFLKKTNPISWHFLINTYAIGVMFVDIAEIVFNQFLGLYTFPTHLLSDPLKDNQLGVLFSDVLILPFTSILFTFYASKYSKRVIVWLFTVIYISLEVLFLKTDYLIYHNWSIWFSFFAYLFGFAFFSLYADRLVHYNPPLSYRIRLFSVVYSITAIVGGVLGGALVKLYQWRPGVFRFPPADDRFADLGLSFVLGVLAAVIIPSVPSRYRAAVFLLLAFSIALFSMYSVSQGWLIYYRWNHVWTAVKWLVPMCLVIVYDRWEVQK